MKKLLRKVIMWIIIICIIVLVGKHTNRFSLTAKHNQISQTGTVSTWIDLTNCVSYFDGCNHCSVKDGKPDACTLMYCEKPTEPKCLQYATGTETTWTDVTTGSTGIANPASVNCEAKWWTLEIVTASDGSQSGMCHLTGWVDCEEWAYFRGECPK